MPFASLSQFYRNKLAFKQKQLHGVTVEITKASMKGKSLALAKLMVGEQKANAAEKQRKLKFRNHSLNNTRLNNKTTSEE